MCSKAGNFKMETESKKIYVSIRCPQVNLIFEINFANSIVHVCMLIVNNFHGTFICKYIKLFFFFFKFNIGLKLCMVFNG